MTHSRLWTRVFLVAVVSGLGRPAAGSGIAVHLMVGDAALDHIEDPGLRQLLIEHQFSYYATGLMFPDSLYFPPMDLSESHDARFLTDYAARIKSSYPDVGSWLSNPESRKLLSHLMGAVGHFADDLRFDKYFLTQVHLECGFGDADCGLGQNGGTGLPEPLDETTCSQTYTDQYMDAALAWQGPWLPPTLPFVPVTNCEMSCVPFEGDCPGPVLCIPGLNMCDFGVGCLNEFSQCYSTACDLVQAVRTTFPQSTADTRMHHITDAVAYHYDITHSLVVLGAIHHGDAVDRCPWAFENDRWLNSLGGVEDCGRVMARYVNKAWEILQAGDVPVFEEGCLSHTRAQILLTDPGTGEAFEYGAWVEVASGVSRVQLLGKERVLYIADGALQSFETPFFEIDHETLLPGVIDVQVEKTRIGALLGDGRLLIKEQFDGPWIDVAGGVLEFDLDELRIAVLVDAPEVIGWPQNALLVTEDLGAPWVEVGTRVLEFQLDQSGSEIGPRIAILQSGQTTPVLAERGGDSGITAPKRFRLKEGPPDAPWQVTLGAVEQFKLAGDDVWVRRKNLDLLVRKGHDDWRRQLTRVTDMDAVGGIVAARVGRRLWIREGLMGPIPPCPYDVNGDGKVTQVDVDQVIDAITCQFLPPPLACFVCEGCWCDAPADCMFDVDGNGIVDILDVVLVESYLGATNETCSWEPKGVVQEFDLIAPDYLLVDGRLERVFASTDGFLCVEGSPADGAVAQFVSGDTSYVPGKPTAALLVGPNQTLYVKD